MKTRGQGLVFGVEAVGETKRKGVEGSEARGIGKVLVQQKGGSREGVLPDK